MYAFYTICQHIFSRETLHATDIYIAYINFAVLKSILIMVVTDIVVHFFNMSSFVLFLSLRVAAFVENMGRIDITSGFWNTNNRTCILPAW